PEAGAPARRCAVSWSLRRDQARLWSLSKCTLAVYRCDVIVSLTERDSHEANLREISFRLVTFTGKNGRNCTKTYDELAISDVLVATRIAVEARSRASFFSIVSAAMNIHPATINGMQENGRKRGAPRGLNGGASPARALPATDLRSRIDKVAAVAAAHAIAVDRESRFPHEAIAAARAERLLSIAVPRELGGEGLSTADVVDVCYALGKACASTAMIYAMHQTKVACLVRHGRGSAWHQLLLRRLCAEQLLLASSTTEGQAGGDVRNSAAPVEGGAARITLERQATVISYGEAADGIVTTARRAADAASSDQVLVAFLKDYYRLERLNGWDALGMRGTCSAGFKLVATGLREQILPEAYEKIHSHTMMPFAHLAWSGAWAGIAAAAVDRA